MHGPEREVFFEQVAVPGREAAIDFTHATDLAVTIAGVPFPHLLFEFIDQIPKSASGKILRRVLRNR